MSHIRNIEQISEDMEVDYFQMQHFITESNWDARMLMDQVAGDVLHGAFCYYLTEGYTRKEALSRAAVIASRSCCYFGTHTWKNHQ